MSIIIPGKLVFFAVPRTGSQAIRQGLERMCKENHIPFCTLNKHHCSPEEMSQFSTGKELVISTIRDPLDLMVTWWKLILQAEFTTFVNFIQNFNHSHMIQNETFFWITMNWEKYWKIHRILRYEDGLQDELNQALEHLELPQIQLETVQSTPDKKPFKEYYRFNRSAFYALLRRCQKDLIEYSYIPFWYWQGDFS